MARKFTASKSQLRPDPRFGSKLASKFINCLMHDGKKSVAMKVFYDALELVERRLPNDNPIEVFNRAVENVKPIIEVRSKRVGGATYQVPIEVRQGRGTTLALRWLIENSRNRREHQMSERLAAEILDASNNTGATVKKREDTHKMAEANKAFAHYRW